MSALETGASAGKQPEAACLLQVKGQWSETTTEYGYDFW